MTQTIDYSRIYAAIAAIPRGRVASYGEIAARAGLPRRARLVGYALRHTPDDLCLPWHRVLRADGCIAFAPNTAAYLEQCQRLLDEGVQVRGGRIALDKFGMRHDVDRALWGSFAAAITTKDAAHA
ncbi:MAG: methylated-DNA--[protein]-cysteine S-methyltransferase [Xanthomonadales bacterium]|nr:methylated-DNA--[protein]-cysteine S-methyltransferase [Xanthomonadales bacterium]